MAHPYVAATYPRNVEGIDCIFGGRVQQGRGLERLQDRVVSFPGAPMERNGPPAGKISKPKPWASILRGSISARIDSPVEIGFVKRTLAADLLEAPAQLIQ